MTNDAKIRTYEIIVDFFVRDLETGGIDDGSKMKVFFKAAKDNGIRPELIDLRTGDPTVFRFKTTRRVAAGLFFDLCENDIIDDELLNDFDNVFEVHDFENTLS